MIRNIWIKIVISGSICIILGAGCGTTRRGANGDTLDQEQLEGDILLGERFEDGEIISDVQFDRVLFGYDSFQIADTEIHKLEKVADYMRHNTDVRLIVEGHCDERGSREYNISLGEHRALAIRAYLVGLGIDGARINTRSYGEEQPVDMGHNKQSWKQNRRGEFVFHR